MLLRKIYSIDQKNIKKNMQNKHFPPSVITKIYTKRNKKKNTTKTTQTPSQFFSFPCNAYLTFHLICMH